MWRADYLLFVTEKSTIFLANSDSNTDKAASTATPELVDSV
jgi:hypothetical protein